MFFIQLPNSCLPFFRLRYSQRGFLTIDGFSELSDAEQDDIDPWIPKSPIIPPDLDIESAKFIVKRVGEKFCELVDQEKEASKSAGEDGRFPRNFVLEIKQQMMKTLIRLLCPGAVLSGSTLFTPTCLYHY